MRIEEGTLVDGRYRVRSLIGSGGMADVWLADDLELSRKVALKVLHAQFARDPQFVERFRREAEAAAKLQQVNIVSIYDRGQVDGTYYIAMAYLDGRTLRELINTGLTVDQSVSIVRQILEAAGFAHRHGVIHRDLKPTNVIVDDSGLATVTDFGIARAGQDEITETGLVMGTANYLSPEQAQAEPVGPSSDVYSVGVILYECLTGRTPFRGDTAVAVALKQMSELPEAPSIFNPAVSPALERVVMTALMRDPADRYQDAESFIAALDEAERDPTGGSPAPERRWGRWIIGGLVALLAFLVILGLLLERQVDVPEVVGKDQDTAIEQLNRSGFEVGEIKRKESQRKANVVLAQDPRGQSGRDCLVLGYFCSNPDVNLTISGGPGQVEIPDVAGLPADEAERQLEDDGLEVVTESQPSDEQDEGLAIGTEPAAGESVRSGSQVTLLVSSGQAQVAVPAVVGLTEEAARQRLSARGLTIDSSEVESDRPAGEVVSQSPDAGEQVDPGSSVKVSVSSGEAAVPVPNLVGQLRSDAENQLVGLGLVPDVVERPTDIEPQDGRVIDQRPIGGRSVASGSTVRLVVGVYQP